MAKFTFDIEIDAPLDRVFAFFAPQRMGYWYGAEIEAQLEVQADAAEFQIGQKVRITGRIGKREVSLTVVITRYQWDRMLEWQFKDSYGVRGLQRWELEPRPGGTHVRMSDEYELPGRWGKLADAVFMKRNVARRNRGYLAQLKCLAERG